MNSSSKPRRPRKKPVPALDPTLRRRVVVENIHPEVDGGRFPIKRVAGETVIVSADVHADGHDTIAAALLYRRAGEEGWEEAAMEPAGNDRWRARFGVPSIGGYEYTVEGWIDRFGSWRHDLSKKVAAGQDVASELLEGAALVRALGDGAAPTLKSWCSR